MYSTMNFNFPRGITALRRKSKLKSAAYTMTKGRLAN